MASARPSATTASFVRRVLIVLGLVASFLLAWQLRIVLLMLFGAVVVATDLPGAGRPDPQADTRLPDGVAVALSILLDPRLVRAC